MRQGEAELTGTCSLPPAEERDRDRLVRALADNSNLKKDNARLRADNDDLARQNYRQRDAVLGYRSQIREAFTRLTGVFVDLEDTDRPLSNRLREIAMGHLRIGIDPEKQVLGK